MTLMPSGRDMLEEAVEEASVPVSAVLCVTMRAPFSGVSVTCRVVLRGMFEAESATVTGFDWLDGRMMSGPPCSDPLGFEGGAMPATETMWMEGRFVGVTTPGVAVEMRGDVPDVGTMVSEVRSNASIRT